MTDKTAAPVSDYASLLAVLEKAGVTATDVENILANAEAERTAAAETNVILLGDETHTGKMLPEDSRGERFPTVDSVREAFFAFAATVSETIVLTAGDLSKPVGSKFRSDKRSVEIPTPHGTLTVTLRLNNN
jgi:hypothetical protein